MYLVLGVTIPAVTALGGLQASSSEVNRFARLAEIHCAIVSQPRHLSFDAVSRKCSHVIGGG